jgi:hypothetical protein
MDDVSNHQASDGADRPVEEVIEPWEFGNNPAAVTGYLRSLDSDRTPDIVDRGDVRFYPSTTGGMLRVFDAKRRTCTSDLCRKRSGDCPHAWEDDFRFGKYKGRIFRVDPAQVQVPKPKSGKDKRYSSGVKRYRKRPNPEMPNGMTFRALMRMARKAMPVETRTLLFDVIKALRVEDSTESTKRGRGQPKKDQYNIAYVAIIKIAERVTYDGLNCKNQELFDAGYISQYFDCQRVVEAMRTAELEELLDRIAIRMIRPFRKVSKWLLQDGVVFSTAQTDCYRKGHISIDGPVQIMIHAVYDYHWGFIPAFRATWHQRSRGSGESVQLPYLLKKSRQVLNYELVLADGAFSTKRNRDFAKSMNYSLMAKPKGDARLSPQEEEIFERIKYFRSRVEGWHAVVRGTTRPYVVSHPDRENYPEQTKAEKLLAEKQKAFPELGDIELPEPFEEREEIIKTEQFVGQRTVNEFQCRRVYTCLRALVKAQLFYEERIDFREDRVFQPRKEEEALSIFRSLDS